MLQELQRCDMETGSEHMLLGKRLVNLLKAVLLQTFNL